MTRWFSDASALTRYGVPTVNYGTSTGLMDVELGENLEIDALVKTAEVYARVAMEVCGRRLSGPSSGTSRPAASKAATSGTGLPTSSPRAASTRSRSRRRP